MHAKVVHKENDLASLQAMSQRQTEIFELLDVYRPLKLLPIEHSMFTRYGCNDCSCFCSILFHIHLDIDVLVAESPLVYGVYSEHNFIKVQDNSIILSRFFELVIDIF